MNISKQFLVKFGNILGLYNALSESEDVLRKLAITIGWDIDTIVGLPVEEISQALLEFTESYQNLVIENIIESPPESLSEFIDTFDSAGQFLKSLQRLESVMESPDFAMPAHFEEFGKDLIQLLITKYLHSTQPVLFHLLILLAIIEDENDLPYTDAVVNDEGKIIRFPYRLAKIRFDRISDLITNPAELFRQEYLTPNGLMTVEDAAYTSNKLFRRLDNFLSVLGLNVVYSINPKYGLDFGNAGNELGSGMLTVYFESDIEDIDFGFTLALSAADRGNLGLVVTPFGEMNHSMSLEEWLIDLAVEGSITGFAVGPNGFVFLANDDTYQVKTRFSADKLSDEFTSDFIFGNENGTRFEVGKFKITASLDLNEDIQDFGIFVDFDSAALVISSGDSDGFLQKILPKDGLRADFDLGLGWSNKKGFHIRGNAGLETTIPIGRSLFGALTIESIYLAISADGESIENTVATSIRTKIGPIEATLGRIGLEAKFTFPEDGGNLGPLNLDFGFKTPTSIGITINTQGVSGGGFLKIDPPHYAGVLLLDVKDKFSIMAVGVLTTELPDGKSGYSMIFQIVAEFSPIQLGLGFALTGVGGMVGINRKLHEQNMRQAIKNHEFDLFPTEAPTDFFAIIDTYESVLPPMEGHHIFGPIVKIHWGGTIKLVEFEVGVFIQIGGPAQVLIVGRAWSTLPDEDSRILELNLDVFGIIDFGDGQLEIEATLFKSKFMGADLDGGMALRADWLGSDKTFALSVGGFHPRFTQIPIGFPVLKRLHISATKGSATITQQLYYAITTNSLQFGSKLDIVAKKSGFKITGGGGYDALIIFNPFSFLVLIYFWVKVSRSWFSVGLDLELELSGPNPLRAKGYVKFSYGFGSKKLRFSKQFGEEKAQRLPEVSPLDILIAELNNSKNVKFEFPAWAGTGVLFREGAESMVDPLADIIISQEAVPLQIEIDKFGGGRPKATERLFDMVANVDADIIAEVKTPFAPAQFVNMSDAQKLSSPAFKEYKSGLRFKSEFVIPVVNEARDLVFETIVRESKNYSSPKAKDFGGLNVARPPCLWAPGFKGSSRIANWRLAGGALNYVHVNKYIQTETAIKIDNSEIAVVDNVAVRLDDFKGDHRPTLGSQEFTFEEEIILTL